MDLALPLKCAPRVVTFPLNFDLSAKSKSRSTTLWFAVTTWQHVSPKQHNWAKLAKGLCPILHRPVFCESASVCRGTSAFTPSACRPLTSAPGAAQPLTPPLLLAPLCVILRNASASLITRSQAFYFAPFRKQSPRAPLPPPHSQINDPPRVNIGGRNKLSIAQHPDTNCLLL